MKNPWHMLTIHAAKTCFPLFLFSLKNPFHTPSSLVVSTTILVATACLQELQCFMSCQTKRTVDRMVELFQTEPLHDIDV